jgi:hypothetical protein
VAPRCRPARAGIKPPCAAVSKRHGGERQGEVSAEKMNGSEPPNKRRNFTRWCQNQGVDEVSGTGAADTCLLAARHPVPRRARDKLRGGMISAWASVRNVGDLPVMSREPCNHGMTVEACEYRSIGKSRIGP